jgi:hypothetical protein
MANRRFTQFFQTPHPSPVLIDCNFKVVVGDAAGFGITGLKGTGVRNVFMHTSATPATGNPNPANGIIIVQLYDNYTKFFASYETIKSPFSGSDVTTTVTNTSYAITTVGTTTLAQWQAVGLPKGVPPAVGAAFTATASQAIGGTGAVQVVATAGGGLDHLEVFGDPNTTINLSAAYATPSTVGFPQIMFQCFKEHVVSAPADNTVISISMYLSNSSVTVAGE